ncbi:hypothetical protein AU476_05605 [Cupriavidus sp. UYMSc13B]|nr:hypothetical protein AU476_05605 [Cupriavidus sp. UYMSc13B]
MAAASTERAQATMRSGAKPCSGCRSNGTLAADRMSQTAAMALSLASLCQSSMVSLLTKARTWPLTSGATCTTCTVNPLCSSLPSAIKRAAASLKAEPSVASTIWVMSGISWMGAVGRRCAMRRHRHWNHHGT